MIENIDFINIDTDLLRLFANTRVTNFHRLFHII